MGNELQIIIDETNKKQIKIKWKLNDTKLSIVQLAKEMGDRYSYKCPHMNTLQNKIAGIMGKTNFTKQEWNIKRRGRNRTNNNYYT